MLLSSVITILSYLKLSFVMMYDNLSDTVRAIIRRDNSNLAGIYCWENKLNNKKYVGRSKNLSKRLTLYFALGELKYMATKSHSSIANAILKYGIGDFRLFILEILPSYDDNSLSDRKLLDSKEGYWVYILKPEYNLKETGIGEYHNPPSPESTANRKKVASHYKQTTWIDCYDFDTYKYLYAYEGIKSFAEFVGKHPSTIRHHLDRGSPLKFVKFGHSYKMRIIRREPKK